DGVGEGNGLLNAEPVLIYAKDLIQLRATPISEWPQFRFWTLDDLGSAADLEVPPDLESYQVWHSRGLPKGPICTPGLSSLQAALNPNTEDGFIYFLAKGDGSNGHVFAHTYEEHLRNIEQYMGGGASSTPTPETASPEAVPTDAFVSPGLTP
ncbi:MAG TPA: endolytic transglycosylase MltG, partial [Candidatus Limnocylindrales bacterium]|nr:endolytic transglycosylase MltG [Candidatus Limnocylindrales bacterium]